MNIIRAYKLSLLLPIIVPILFAPAFIFIRSLGESGATVLITILFSLVYGGIPYLILVGILLFWMRGKNEPQIRRTLLLSPLLMIVIFQVYAGLWIAFFSEGTGKINQFVGSLIVLSPFVLLFGYIYIGIAFGIIELLKKKSVFIVNTPSNKLLDVSGKQRLS